MAVYIFAARIYLDSDPTVANASDIGLYDDADNGTNQVFRWIESDITSYSPTYTWKTGIFTPQPIDNINEGVDLSLGGNLPSVNGTNVRIGNTLPIGGTMTQFDATVDGAGIRFNGLRCDIMRFEVSAGALVSADGDIVFRGICGDPQWNEREFSIPVQNSNIKRESNLGTIITDENYPNADAGIIGQSVPVTFGEYKPEFDDNDNPLWNGYSQFKRTANEQEIIKLINPYPTGTIMAGDELNIIFLEYGDIPPSKRNRSIFPIVDNDLTDAKLTYQIDIGSEMPAWTFLVRGITVTTGKYRIANFEGAYLFVIEAKVDTSSMQGKYRRITKAEVDLDVDNSLINLTLESYFEISLQGNATANHANQCWIQMVSIERKYSADVWPCKNYLDEDGNVIKQGLNLLSYESPKKAKVTTENTDANVEEQPLSFYRLPQYAFIESLLGINNEIDIDVKLFESNPDQMNSFLIVQLDNLEEIVDVSEVVEFGVTSETWTQHAPGIFKNNNVFVSAGVTGDLTNLTDKKHNTRSRFFAEQPDGTMAILWALKFSLPDYPKRFEHDSIYFGL